MGDTPATVTVGEARDAADGAGAAVTTVGATATAMTSLAGTAQKNTKGVSPKRPPEATTKKGSDVDRESGG